MKSKDFFSQLYHLAAYMLKQPKTRLETGMFILSIDVDVGSKALGLINKGRNDVNVSSNFSEYSVGEMEEQALPLLIAFFNDIEVPVTFAIRGQLMEVDDFGRKLFHQSSVEHDIGAHGYYHRVFTDLSENEAENELKMISLGMRRLNIIPRSFVFPRNKVAHLNLLEKYGYKCYRSNGNFINDSMYIEKEGRLYNIHPSLYLGQSRGSVFLRKILDIAVTKRLPFHLWFHLWNLGETTELVRRNIEKVLVPLLDYAKEKERRQELTFETMLSATERFESFISSKSPK